MSPTPEVEVERLLAVIDELEVELALERAKARRRAEEIERLRELLVEPPEGA